MSTHEVKVRILLDRLLVTLVTVQGHAVASNVGSGGVFHHFEEGMVEFEVVTVVSEVVVTRKRAVGFELVVAIETGLRASHSRTNGSAGGGIATDGEALGSNVTIGGSETEDGEKGGKVVANVVHLLLSIDELVEGGDTIVAQEVVVGSWRIWSALDISHSEAGKWNGTCVESRARSTNVLCVVGCNKVMGSITRSWDEVASNALAGQAAVGIVVWVCRVVRGGTGVIRIEGAILGAARAIGICLLALEKRAVNAGLVGNPGEGDDRFDQSQGENRFGEHGEGVVVV